jgi:hypothetical protein
MVNIFSILALTESLRNEKRLHIFSFVACNSVGKHPGSVSILQTSRVGST